MQVINRIKTLEAQISAIEKILKRGEFEAAGLSLALNVGPVGEDRSPELNLDLSWDLAPILEGILKSLNGSLAQNMSMGRKELSELQAFFGPRA